MTWIEEREGKWLKRRLPAGYEWGVQWAGRQSKKGRAMGGMIMGIRGASHLTTLILNYDYVY